MGKPPNKRLFHFSIIYCLKVPYPNNGRAFFLYSAPEYIKENHKQMIIIIYFIFYRSSILNVLFKEKRK